MLSAVILCALTLSSATLANELPGILRDKPRLSDYDWTARVSGYVRDREDLMQRPRVVFGYLSEKNWAFVEFLCFMHASWRYVTSMAKPTGYRLDLLVFAERRWLREAASICRVLDLEALRAEGFATLLGAGDSSRCWVVPYPRPPDRIWQGYPFVASYHYLADERVGSLLTSVYGYALKTDFDCFLTATLIHHFPRQLEVGRMHYTPLPTTAARLRRVADDLGLRHRGLHDIGPTWYGDAATLVALGNASLPLVHYLLDWEFETDADGSWRRNWAAGEGWPLWSKDMAVMYGTELALNHLVEHFEVSNKYDVHGDSERYTFGLYHIHCQHGDGNFSKFEFFQHNYSDRDLSTGLDFNVVKDFALWLSVDTWRGLHATPARGTSAGGAGQGERRVASSEREAGSGQMNSRAGEL